MIGRAATRLHAAWVELAGWLEVGMPAPEVPAHGRAYRSTPPGRWKLLEVEADCHRVLFEACRCAAADLGVATPVGSGLLLTRWVAAHAFEIAGVHDHVWWCGLCSELVHTIEAALGCAAAVEADEAWISGRSVCRHLAACGVSVTPRQLRSWSRASLPVVKAASGENRYRLSDVVRYLSERGVDVVFP